MAAGPFDPRRREFGPSPRSASTFTFSGSPPLKVRIDVAADRVRSARPPAPVGGAAGGGGADQPGGDLAHLQRGRRPHRPPLPGHVRPSGRPGRAPVLGGASLPGPLGRAGGLLDEPGPRVPRPLRRPRRRRVRRRRVPQPAGAGRRPGRAGLLGTMVITHGRYNVLSWMVQTTEFARVWPYAQPPLCPLDGPDGPHRGPTRHLGGPLRRDGHRGGRSDAGRLPGRRRGPDLRHGGAGRRGGQRQLVHPGRPGRPGGGRGPAGGRTRPGGAGPDRVVAPRLRRPRERAPGARLDRADLHPRRLHGRRRVGRLADPQGRAGRRLPRDQPHLRAHQRRSGPQLPRVQRHRAGGDRLPPALRLRPGRLRPVAGRPGGRDARRRQLHPDQDPAHRPRHEPAGAGLRRARLPGPVTELPRLGGQGSAGGQVVEEQAGDGGRRHAAELAGLHEHHEGQVSLVADEPGVRFGWVVVAELGGAGLARHRPPGHVGHRPAGAAGDHAPHHVLEDGGRAGLEGSRDLGGGRGRGDDELGRAVRSRRRRWPPSPPRSAG